MRALWLLTLLVAGALADHHHEEDCDCPGGSRWGSIAARTSTQEADINRVAGRIEALAGRMQANIDNFKNKMLPDFRDMVFRVNEIQGNPFSSLCKVFSIVKDGFVTITQNSGLYNPNNCQSSFKKKIPQFPNVEPMSFLNIINLKLAGNGCEKRHYQCGGDEPRCISDLLVCDGSPDCPNGSDEDEDTCRESIHFHNL